MDKSDFLDINKLTIAQGLEIPVPKKRRLRQLSSESLQSISSTTKSEHVEIEETSLPWPASPSPRPASPSQAPASPWPGFLSPASAVPSPANFMECEASASSDEDIRSVNYGSEESDDDDESSRMCITLQETPSDIPDAMHSEIFEQAPPSPNGVPPEETEKPWRWYDFEWNNFPDVPTESRRETFSNTKVGPTTLCNDPYDLFLEIWDREIVEHIASETNRYAEQLTAQMIANGTLLTSRIENWTEVTVDDIYVYMGIVLAMGVVVKPILDDYWSTNLDIFITPGFNKFISSRQFYRISRCLHFNNNEDINVMKLNASDAKLLKIEPILSHVNKKFQSLYVPDQNIVLDNCDLKVAKNHIQTYEVCDSKTGYLWRFDIQARMNDDKDSLKRQLQDPMDAYIPSLVLRLVKGLEYKGYTLWMDHFYNSPCVARRLKSLGFDCVGTLSIGRQFVPPSLQNLTQENMASGQSAVCTSGDVDILVWKGNHRISMLSTYHDNHEISQEGPSQPIVISDYNAMISGVDKKNKILTTYPTVRLKPYLWYKKIFCYLLNITIVNLYVIYCHNHKKPLPHKEFRQSLINTLLKRHFSSEVNEISPLNKNGNKCDMSHRVAKFPFIMAQRHRRACVCCKKRTAYHCVGCAKSVCIEPCFVELHK